MQAWKYHGLWYFNGGMYARPCSWSSKTGTIVPDAINGCGPWGWYPLGSGVEAWSDTPGDSAESYWNTTIGQLGYCYLVASGTHYSIHSVACGSDLPSS